MQNILITGATGFIGGALVRKLAENKDFSLACIVRDLDKPLPVYVKKIGLTEANLNLATALDRHLNGVQIDCVIHLATLFKSAQKTDDIPALISSNLTFGTQLLDWMSQHQVKSFINVGSFAQFVDGKTERAQNLYAATKTAFEKFVDYYTQAFAMKTQTLYLYDTYGPNDTRPKLINLILNALKAQAPLKMSPGFQEICYVHVDDVVDAIHFTLKNMESFTTGTHHKNSVYSPDVLSVRDLVELSKNITGQSFEPEFGFYPYRNFEIMKFSPRYPLLPNWQSKVSLREGIASIWKGL